MAYPKVGNRGTGRRKCAITRVRLVPGTGKILINGQDAEEYLGFRKSLMSPILAPLKAAGVEDRYNVLVNANGGGKSGQAQAITLGIARALVDVSDSNHDAMRAGGFLTRDPRVKERKKYGQKRARKRFQFSKR